MAKIKNFYAGANSSIGFYSLFDEVIKGLDSIYILKGGPGTGKSTLMRKIGLVLMDKGLDLEYYHCSSDNQSLDGVVVPELKLGIVDGTPPHIVEPKYPGVVEKVIDMGEACNRSELAQFKKEIVNLTDQMLSNFNLAYQTFAEAKKIHFQKEDIYIEAMDFKKADKVRKELSSEIFSVNCPRELNPENKKRFFGAATPKGVVHFIDNITEDLSKRYIIKGRPGSGKSTLMKKIGKEAEERGYSVHYYPCGFDPYSIDMIVIPTLSVCFVDGTAPHWVDPFRQHDEVIDMYGLCVNPRVEDGKSGEVLQELNIQYKALMSKATNYLSEAKRLQDALEEYYSNAMNFDMINQIRSEVLEEILRVNDSVKMY